MSLFLDGVDPFDGLRVLPREPEELRHHLSRINHTLQTRYFIVKETAEFALQPDQTGEFIQFYQKEVQKIVSHLNKTTRSNIKVRVDPLRLAKGTELQRSGGTNKDAGGKVAPTAESEDPAWVASLVDTGKRLAEKYAVEQQLLLSATPAAQTSAGFKGAHGATAATVAESNALSPDLLAATIVADTEARQRKSSCLFSTPPEFKGFNVPMATPSESDGHSPGV